MPDKQTSKQPPGPSINNKTSGADITIRSDQSNRTLVISLLVMMSTSSLQVGVGGVGRHKYLIITEIRIRFLPRISEVGT